MINLETAKTIKQTRKTFGLTQMQCATLARVTRSHWARYEDGRTIMPDLRKEEFIRNVTTFMNRK